MAVDLIYTEIAQCQFDKIRSSLNATEIIRCLAQILLHRMHFFAMLGQIRAVAESSFAMIASICIRNARM